MVTAVAMDSIESKSCLEFVESPTPAVKFDSCNNLLSFVHTACIVLRSVRLYIKRKLLLLLLDGVGNYS